MGVFITPFGICPLAAEKAQIGLPVDRPVDRPTVKKVTVEPSGRPCQIQRVIALWPVDHPVDRAKAYGRPPPPESGVTSVGRSHGRSAKPTWPLCTSCAHRSTGSVDRLLVWSTVPVDRRSLAGIISEYKNWSF